MMYLLTQGQWDTVSPDYRREMDGRKYFLQVDPDTLATSLVPVEIVPVPVVPEVPRHYGALWPLDPRD